MATGAIIKHILRSTAGCKQRADSVLAARVCGGHKNTENVRKNVQYCRWRKRFKSLSSERKTLFSWVSNFKAIGSTAQCTEEINNSRGDNHIVASFQWKLSARRLNSEDKTEQKVFSMVDWGPAERLQFLEWKQNKKCEKRLEILQANFWKFTKVNQRKWSLLHFYCNFHW